MNGISGRHNYEKRYGRNFFSSLASNAVTRFDAILADTSARL